MSDLSDDRKRQILAEEQYREQVRRQLQGGRPPPSPPQRPARRPRKGHAGTGLLVSGALLLTAGVISLLIGLGYRRAGGDNRAELTARGGGPLAPVPAGSWKASELGFDDLVVGPDGTISTRPHPGVATLAALAEELGVAPPPGPATAGRFDDLLDHVPPDAFAVVAVDLEQARGSPGLMAALDKLLRESGYPDRIDVLATGKRLVLAGMSRGGSEPEPLLLVDDPGPPLPGDSVLEAGALREAIAQGAAGTTGFVALTIPPEVRGDAAGMLGDLVNASWMVATIDARGGVAIAGTARFADDATAGRAAGALDLLRRLGAGQAPPDAAAALGKIAITSAGTDMRVTANLDDTDVIALVALVN